METKPLNVRAAEACGLELFQANGLHGALTWMIAERNSPGRLLPYYHTDDAAALHLLKAWRNGSGLRAALVSFKVDGTYRVELFHDGMMFHGDDPSLARAICLALVAAKESH